MVYVYLSVLVVLTRAMFSPLSNRLHMSVLTCLILFNWTRLELDNSIHALFYISYFMKVLLYDIFVIWYMNVCL